MSLDAFLDAHKLPAGYKTTALKWFTPVVEHVATHQKNSSSPFVLGIHGCQGSGKSTLADFIAHQLKTNFDLRVVVCSLDDFYLSQNERKKLADTIHPLLKTRGVPGTHDVHLLEQVLLHVNQQNTLSPLAVPRFDKSTDNPLPHAQWDVVSMPIDVFIIEGWCWGTPAQKEDELSSPINDLERIQDPSGIWRNYVNKQIRTHYEPLYGFVDEWVMLKAPSFLQVATWREEQEQKLRNQHEKGSAKKIMTPEQVLEFITYFERLTNHALQNMAKKCQWVFELGKNREIVKAIHSNGEFS